MRTGAPRRARRRIRPPAPIVSSSGCGARASARGGSRAGWESISQHDIYRPTVVARDVTLAEYRALAEFRQTLRRFYTFSAEAARAAGLQPQQHQLLLLLRGLPGGAE